MFKQLGLAIVISIAMGSFAVAQTAPKIDPKAETSKPKPKSDTTKKSKEKTKSKDLDAFFKEGEKQMEEGPSCQPPPDPIV